MKLKRVDIFQAKTIRGATKIPTELRYRIEVRLLRRRRQIADRHVLDHAAAKRADLSHRKTSCLKGGAAKNPRSSQTGGNYCDRPLTAAPAASFNPWRVSDSAGWYYITAALLVIGDKILSGRTKDQNIGYVAEYLTALGVNLLEVRVVGDEETAIVDAVNALRHRYTYVFTTGGIGPTHDDITADSVA